MEKYKAVRGSRHVKSDKDAEVIGVFIEKKFKGKVTPYQLLKEAAKKNCPIHKYFEWDNDVAAESWRVHQARQILGSIVVVIEDVPVRAYQNVYVGKQKYYVKTEEARKDVDMWDQVVKQALDEAYLWKERYKNYKQLSPIVDAIELVENELTI